MRARRILLVLGGLALAAVLVVGLVQTGGGSSQKDAAPSGAAAARRLAGSPAPLAALHRQSGRLLPGSPDTFRARLAALRGYPVVVNKWASWCGPCRFEFPAFQRASVDLGRRVAFVGLNSGDNSSDAADFLRSRPVAYPSYEDPAEKIARAIGAPANYPITVFYDRRGRRAFVHQGPYRSAAELRADVRRYAERT